MLTEIRETRRELARLNADLGRLGTSGAQSGRTFGQKFKTAALTGVKEMAKGAASALGAHLASKLFSSGEKSGRSYGRGFKKSAKKEIDTLSSNPAASGMKLNLGGMGLIGAGVLSAAIASQLRAGLSKAFEAERLTISFNALSLDGAGGSRIFESLRADALRTGQDIESMAGSLQRFLGLGFAEEEALKLNDALLDIAGGLGLSNAEAAGLGGALAQVKAKGVASMEELRQQIAEKGIPVMAVLAEKLGITEAAVISMVSAGKLGADVVVDAFMNMEGAFEKYRGGADRAANTTGGLFQRMLRHAEDLKMKFAEGLLPELKLTFLDAIGAMERLKAGAILFGKTIGEVFGTIRAAIKGLSLLEMFQLAALTYRKAMDDAFVAIQRNVIGLLEMMKSDEFGRGLERAALTFKAIMLAVMYEVANALEEVMPDTIKGRQAKLAIGGAKNQFMIRSNIAMADLDHVAAPSGEKLLEIFKKAKADARILSTFTPDQQASMADLEAKIKRQREADKQAAAERDAALAAPAAAGTRQTAAAAPVTPPGGILAGGLANALSRISGGASTLLMSRQLETMQSTLTATQKNVTATEKVGTEVAALRREMAYFS